MKKIKELELYFSVTLTDNLRLHQTLTAGRKKKQKKKNPALNASKRQYYSVGVCAGVIVCAFHGIY